MGIMAPIHRFVVLNVLDELTHLRCLEQDQVVSALAMFSSVAQSCLTLRPHETQHARPPCLSPTPGVHYFLKPS